MFRLCEAAGITELARTKVLPVALGFALVVGAVASPPARAAEPSASAWRGIGTMLAQAKPAQDKLITKDDELLLDDDKKPAASGDGNDLLKDSGDKKKAVEAKPLVEDKKDAAKGADAEHEALFAEARYPSANTCATCHPRHYAQWSVSQHAYAQISPIFNAMQSTINAKTSTTNGDFCIRCHTQVGMNMGEDVFISNLDRHPTSREGITCVVCHRVNINYGKISGRFALVEGDLYTPIFGPTGNQELKRVLADPQTFRVSADRNKPGRGIHGEVEKFFALTTPAFCGACHDVTLFNGFRLEEAFAEYKRSPAARKGVSCQDCHMSKVQGIAAGYDQGPAAIVGGEATKPRKLTNHFFAGPDYSIVHPGIFPHNVKAARMRTLREWLQFDVEAGWGTDKFENSVPKDYTFPETWASIDDRYDARAIIDEQLERLAWARERRLEVLRNGIDLSDIRVTHAGRDGIAFEIDVKNITEGHGVPTGFDAERLMFLEVTVADKDGRIVHTSGDRDPNGDVRDMHSLFVHNGELPLDGELFNLQSKFVVRPVRGAEREQILAVNTSADALPFVRPETRPTTLFGRPRGARKHKQNIEPVSHRTASYEVDGAKLTKSQEYHITVRFISQMVPVNLLTAIQGVGFDYGMSPKKVADELVKGASVVREKKAVVKLEGRQSTASKQ